MNNLNWTQCQSGNTSTDLGTKEPNRHFFGNLGKWLKFLLDPFSFHTAAIRHERHVCNRPVVARWKNGNDLLVCRCSL